MSAPGGGGSTTVVQLLTCFLALCSALAFVLLYKRGRWSTPLFKATKRFSSSSHHRHKAHRPSSLLLSSSSSLRLDGSPRSGSPVVQSLLLLPISIRPPPKSTPPSKKAVAAAAASALSSPPLSVPLLSQPVIVTLTTLPSRLQHIDRCLASLRAQSYPVHRLVLVLPQSLPYRIPERLLQASWLSVVRPEEDWGALSRLVAVADDWHDAYVISVDDDVVYDRGMVEGLVRQSREAGEGVVLGYGGYRLRGGQWVKGNVEYVRRWEEGLVDDDADAEDDGWWDGDTEEEGLIERALNRTRDRLNSRGSASPTSSRHHSRRSSHRSDSPVLLCHPPARPSRSPSPSFPSAVYPTEAADVLLSYRGVLYPPHSLPSSAVMMASLSTFPSSVLYVDDEFVCALLASQGIARRVVVASFDPVQAHLKLKDGRWSEGGTVAAVRMQRRWSESMEALVRRGWWGAAWEVEDEKAGQRRKETADHIDWSELIVEDDGVGLTGEALLLGARAEKQGSGVDERKEEADDDAALRSSAIHVK